MAMLFELNCQSWHGRQTFGNIYLIEFTGKNANGRRHVSAELELIVWA